MKHITMYSEYIAIKKPKLINFSVVSHFPGMHETLGFIPNPIF